MDLISEEDEPPGRTPFFGARNLGRVLHLDKIFFKFEGMNLTGTQKDRISSIHVKNAANLGFQTVSVATCGNFGASISYFAQAAGLKSVIMVPENYANSRNDEMLSYGSEILRTPGKYEDSVEFLHDIAADNSWYDASPGSEHSGLDMKGYGEISREIVSQLGHAPEYIAVPVGNGTTLGGIYLGFRSLYERGLADRIPKFIASSTANGNPIVDSWRKRKKHVIVLDPTELRESTVNEPLISYKSFDGQIALDAIYASKGFAVPVTDEEMIHCSRMIEKYENISVLPASCSAMVAASKILRRHSSNSECVVVLTGRGRLWTTQ